MAQTFKVTSGMLVISDPCYKRGTWCQGVIPAKNGVWEVYVERDPNTGRIANISAWNVESAIDNPSLPNEVYNGGDLPFSFGVDTGQFGYFDESFYRNDEKLPAKTPLWNEYVIDRNEEGDKFYSACCNLTLGKSKYGVLPFGLVASSGYGDGEYPTTGMTDKNGDYIALSTTFIYDQREEEDDDDEFEEAQFEDDENGD